MQLYACVSSRAALLLLLLLLSGGRIGDCVSELSPLEASPAPFSAAAAASVAAAAAAAGGVASFLGPVSSGPPLLLQSAVSVEGPMLATGQAPRDSSAAAAARAAAAAAAAAVSVNAPPSASSGKETRC